MLRVTSVRRTQGGIRVTVDVDQHHIAALVNMLGTAGVAWATRLAEQISAALASASGVKFAERSAQK